MYNSCCGQVYFSTGPEATPTHWQQVVLLLEESLQLSKGVGMVLKPG